MLLYLKLNYKLKQDQIKNKFFETFIFTKKKIKNKNKFPEKSTDFCFQKKN